MQKLNESPVTPDQIDSLGHLNVRYYIARMDLGNRQLLEAHALRAIDDSQGPSERCNTARLGAQESRFDLGLPGIHLTFASKRSVLRDARLPHPATLLRRQVLSLL